MCKWVDGTDLTKFLLCAWGIPPMHMKVVYYIASKIKRIPLLHWYHIRVEWYHVNVPLVMSLYSWIPSYKQQFSLASSTGSFTSSSLVHREGLIWPTVYFLTGLSTSLMDFDVSVALSIWWARDLDGTSSDISIHFFVCPFHIIISVCATSLVARDALYEGFCLAGRLLALKPTTANISWSSVVPIGMSCGRSWRRRFTTAASWPGPFGFTSPYSYSPWTAESTWSTEVHLSTTLEKNVSPQGTESTQSTLVTILAKTDRIQVISMETNMFICHLFTNYAN